MAVLCCHFIVILRPAKALETFYFPREALTLQPYVPNLTFGTIEFHPIPIVPILKVTQFFLFDRLGPLVY